MWIMFVKQKLVFHPMEYESCDFDSASLILSFCQPHFGSPERLLPTRSLGSCQSSGEPSEEGAPQVRMD